MRTNAQFQKALAAEGEAIGDIFDGFVAAMLWAGTYGPEGEERPIDDTYGPDDLTVAARVAVLERIRRFRDVCGPVLWDRMLEETPDGADFSAAERIGHDLYLTSAGHGVGFWDRDWYDATLREMLTDAAKRVPRAYADVYRGRVYVY